MSRLQWTLALAVACALLVVPQAWAQKRVALAIGNSAYQYTSKLENLRNDATDMAAALRKLGFQVLDGFDLDKPAFERKVRDFSVSLREAKVGLFFYAGHGLQVAGLNYLVPIDAKAETADALDWEMVRLDLVHRTMERATNTNIIFLDACRNNPLARNIARAMGTRSAEIGRGLAPVESGVGTLISFSTQPGNVALDGVGRNSPFAGALVRQLSSSTDDLSAILIDVRNDVRKQTENKQVPWEHSALTGRFYFNPTATAKSSSPQVGAQSEAAQTWATIKDSTNQSVLEAFAKQFKDTVYSALAMARLEELRKPTPDKSAPTSGGPSVTAMPAPPGSQTARTKVGGEFTSVRHLGCLPARADSDRLAFSGAQKTGFKALRIQSWGNDVDINEVIVRYTGDVRPASYQDRIFIKFDTTSAPILLDEHTQPISQVTVTYRAVTKRPSPSLCVEGLN